VARDRARLSLRVEKKQTKHEIHFGGRFRKIEVQKKNRGKEKITEATPKRGKNLTCAREGKEEKENKTVE
jgi:hypothetical protein